MIRDSNPHKCLMNLSVQISIPFLWDGQTFHKDEWGAINFLVGPNGTGKTLFAEQLRTQCQNQGMIPRYLSGERLYGWV
jgi:pantothenate kinase-related protein Tda10